MCLCKISSWMGHLSHFANCSSLIEESLPMKIITFPGKAWIFPWHVQGKPPYLDAKTHVKPSFLPRKKSTISWGPKPPLHPCRASSKNCFTWLNHLFEAHPGTRQRDSVLSGHRKGWLLLLVGGWPTPLKNISQIGSSSKLLGKIKHVPNHQPVFGGLTTYTYIYIYLVGGFNLPEKY